MDEERAKLFAEAFKKPGIQGADIAYYSLLFLPLITGICGFAFWANAMINKPHIPKDRLDKLFYASCVLMGGPFGVDYLKKAKDN